MTRGGARGSLATFIGASLLVVGSLSPVAAASPTDGQIDAAIDARERLGLKADRAHVKELLAREPDRTSAKHGFPLTKAEAAELDERSAWSVRVSEQTVPHVRRLADYGGHWIDQRARGQLVVGLTRVTDAAKSSVRSRMPAKSRGVRFEEVDDSAAKLQSALERSESVWQSLGLGFMPQATAVHYRHNRLTFKVLPGHLQSAKDRKQQLSNRLGVKVAFAASGRAQDLACTKRWKCYEPLKPGARAFYQATGASWRCGVGFHVVHKTNSNAYNHGTFLTAGHCTHNRGGNWYQGDSYKIGGPRGTRYDTTHKRDLALIKIDKWSKNKAKWIFGESHSSPLYTDYGVVNEGDYLCTSLAQSGKDENGNQWWCGTADSAFLWIGSWRLP